MKLAMAMAGRLKSAVVRPPTQQPDDKTREEIARVLKNAGLLQKEAA
jgi:dihydrodipicolinate synthase/N-acetylneuraminate lyase